MPWKDDPAFASLFDCQFIGARQFLVGFPCSLAGRRFGTASFDLLSMEDVVEIHHRLLASPSNDRFSPGERQMSEQALIRHAALLHRRTDYRGAVSRIVNRTGSTPRATIAIMIPGAVGQCVRSTRN